MQCIASAHQGLLSLNMPQGTHSHNILQSFFIVFQGKVLKKLDVLLVHPFLREQCTHKKFGYQCGVQTRVSLTLILSTQNTRCTDHSCCDSTRPTKLICTFVNARFLLWCDRFERKISPHHLENGHVLRFAITLSRKSQETLTHLQELNWNWCAEKSQSDKELNLIIYGAYWSQFARGFWEDVQFSFVWIYAVNRATKHENHEQIT